MGLFLSFLGLQIIFGCLLCQRHPIDWTPTTGWFRCNISPRGFFCWALCFSALFLLAPTLAYHVLAAIPFSLGSYCIPLLAALLSQLVIICLLLLPYYRKRPLFSDTIRPRNSGNIVWRAFLAYLKTTPIVYCASFMWAGFLEILTRLGCPLDFPLQPLVQLMEKGLSVPNMVLLFLSTIVLAPVAEELFFRAGLLRFFCSRGPVRESVFFSSLIFSLFHFNISSFVSIFIFGILLSLLYLKERNIWLSIFTHAFFNLNSVILLLIIGHYE